MASFLDDAVEIALEAYNDTYTGEYLATGATDNKEAAMRSAVEAVIIMCAGDNEAIAVDEGRERVVRWMIERSYATGHGDTMEDLLSELAGEGTHTAVASMRERAAKVADKYGEHAIAGKILALPLEE